MEPGTSPDNPFAAPKVLDSVVPEPGRDLRRLRNRWLFSVALNLPVPVWFGLGATSDLGRLGMAVGVFVVAWVGWNICGSAASVMSALCNGSILVGLSQFWPVLHMFVGLAAIMFCETVYGESHLTGILSGTTATIVTGIGLIVPSLVFGVVGREIRRIYG